MISSRVIAASVIPARSSSNGDVGLIERLKTLRLCKDTRDSGSFELHPEELVSLAKCRDLGANITDRGCILSKGERRA